MIYCSGLWRSSRHDMYLVKGLCIALLACGAYVYGAQQETVRVVPFPEWVSSAQRARWACRVGWPVSRISCGAMSA